MDLAVHLGFAPPKARLAWVAPLDTSALAIGAVEPPSFLPLFMTFSTFWDDLPSIKCRPSHAFSSAMFLAL